MAAGGFLFVSGHDPERRGVLRYRGRAGRELTPAQTRAAVRLATLNALAAARAVVGSLARLRRCVALTCFVDATPDALRPGVVAGGLAVVRQAFGPTNAPVVWLRPARGLAGGMPVEIELWLELADAKTAAQSARSAGKRSRASAIRGPYQERSLPSTKRRRPAATAGISGNAWKSGRCAGRKR